MPKDISAFAGACVISIAIGFMVGKVTSPKPDESETSSEARWTGEKRTSTTGSRSRNSSQGSDALSDLLNGRSPRDIEPSDLTGIISKLATYDPDIDSLTRARQHYQLQLLLAQLSPTQLESIATAATTNKDPKETGTIHTVLLELAAKDPERALAWTKAQDDSDLFLSIVISQMAATDPNRAADLFRESLIDGSVSGSSVWQTSYAISRSMAKLGIEPLMDFMDTLPGSQRSSVIHNVMSFVPEGEEATLLDRLFKDEGKEQQPFFSFDSIFSQAALKNPEASEAWLANIDDKEKRVSLGAAAAVMFIQQGNPEAAGDWLETAFNVLPGKEKEIFLKAAQNSVYNDPESIPKLAALLPQGTELTADDLSQYAQNSLHNGTGALASIADAIPNPDEKAKLITNTLATLSNPSSRTVVLGSMEMEILSQKISRMGFTGQNLESVSTAIDTLRESQNR